MNKRAREIRREIERELQRLGCQEYSFEDGKHQVVNFVVGSLSRFFVFPSSPSDVRSQKNAVSQLRRVWREAMEKQQ